MNSEVEIPETPNWLNDLEAKREHRLKARLGHEAGAGAPCLKCADKCPGLDLHFWRKCCKICKCAKEEHEVQDDDIYGWAQFQLLGSKPNKIRNKILLPGKKDELELDWIPKGHKETVEKYLKTLPQDQLPVKGSPAAQSRRQQLQRQIPIHDIDPALCHELNEDELKKMNEYIAFVKKNIVGVGQIVNLSNIIKSNLHMLNPNEAALILTRYPKGIPLSEIVKLQAQSKSENLNQNLQKLNLNENKHLPNYKPNNSSNQIKSVQNPVAISKIHDKIYPANSSDANVDVNIPMYSNPLKIDPKSVHDPKLSQNLTQDSNYDPKLVAGSIVTQNLQYDPNLVHSQSVGTQSGHYDPKMITNPNLTHGQSAGLVQGDYYDPKMVSGSMVAQNLNYDPSLIHSKPIGTQNVNQSDSYHPEMVHGTVVPPNLNYEHNFVHSQSKSDPKYDLPGSKYDAKYVQTQNLSYNPSPIHSQSVQDPKWSQKINQDPTLNKNLNYQSFIDAQDPKWFSNLQQNPNFDPKLVPSQFLSNRPSAFVPYSKPKPEEQVDPNGKIPGSIKDLAFSTYDPNQIPVYDPNKGPAYDPNQFPIYDPAQVPMGEQAGHFQKPLSVLHPHQKPDVPEDLLHPNEVQIGSIHDINYPEIKSATHGTNDFYEDYSPDSIKEILNNVKLPDCHYCKKPFEENEFAVTVERANVLFHAECFRCAGCNQILADNVYFYSRETDNIYCGRDYAKIRGFPRCNACDELIFTKEYCLAENSTFHLKHFCCYQCDIPLAGQDYTLEEGMPYCLPCFEQSKANRCSFCENIIKPDEIGCNLNGVHFHADDRCFSCRVCRKPLMKKKMLLRNGKLYCSHECFNQ